MVTRPGFALAGEPVAEFVPVVDLADGRLLGMEATVRWEHPEHGRIPSERLLPWADKNGEIVPIGQWLAGAACDEAMRWSHSVQLAVGTTAGQLRRGQGSVAVGQALAVSGLDPGRLTVEVPEQAVTDPAALADIRALAGLGVELAVVDVGSGLDSFDPLRRLSMGTVKIGGELVDGLESAAGMGRLVAEAVIDMAHAAGMAVIAAGVTVAGQVSALVHLGADAGQGPFFSGRLSTGAAAELAGAELLPRFSRTEACRVVTADAGRPGGAAVDRPPAPAPADGRGEPGDPSPGGEPGAAPADPEAEGPDATQAPGDGTAPAKAAAKKAPAKKAASKKAPAKKASTRKPTGDGPAG